MTAEEWFNTGIALDHLGRYEEALDAYNKAIEINSQDAEAWCNKGVALSQLGRYKEELSAYNKAIEINPQFAEAWYNKGVVLGQFGKYEEALGAFNKAIEIKPQFTEAWYNNGVALSRLGRHEEALDAFNKTIEINSQYAEAWYGKGFALSRLSRHEEALGAFNKTIEIKPQYAEAWNNKGFALSRLSRHEEALGAFNKAIEINPQYALAYGNSAEILFNLGALEQASTNVNQAINLNDKLTSALLLRGKIEIEKKDYVKASEFFTQAISTDLNTPLPLFWNAYTRYIRAEFSFNHKSREYQEEIVSIIRQLERADELFKKGNRDKEIRACSLYFLGCFYYKAKNIFQAKRKLEECVKLKSKSPIELSARELLGNIWDNVIRPPLWQWWLGSPLNCWLRRIMFGVISLSILGLLLCHPFVLARLPTVDLTLYIVLILILISILALPSIQRIRVGDIEVELHSPLAIESVFPSEMERKLKELEACPLPVRQFIHKSEEIAHSSLRLDKEPDK